MSTGPARVAPELDRVEDLLQAICAATGADDGAELFLDDGEGVLQLVAHSRPQPGAGWLRPGIGRAGGRATETRSARLMMRLPDGMGGLLVLRRRTADEFSPGDRAVARLYARQLVEPTNIAVLQPKTTPWTRQLEVIQRVCAQLTRLTTIDGIAACVCRETRQVMDYDSAFVYLVSDDGATLEPVAYQAFTDNLAPETREFLRMRMGQGLPGWVARRGEPLLIHDAHSDARATRTTDARGTRDEVSMLLVPLREQGQVTGVIVLSKQGLARFDSDDLHLLQILSEQAAVAIENARLLAARERMVSELNWMLDISHSYTQADSELPLAGLLATKLAGAGQAEACVISRWDATSGVLRTLGARGVADVAAAYDVLGSDTTRTVLVQARPEVVQAVGRDPHGQDVRLMDDLGAQTLLLLPMLAASGTIGLVELFWVTNAMAFRPDELDVFRTMANQAGTVLENARLVEQLREAADIDQLTGVHNHRYLQERLAQEIARARRSRAPLGLLMIDLNGFKAVNDSHGHAAGDRVLRSVSSRLLLTVRETDVVARYGGDEFVVLMPDTSPAASREVAHRVAKALGGRGYELGDGTIAAVTASVGLATSPEDGRSPKALLDVADQRMYGVKRGGSERAGRSPAMSPQTLRRI